MLKIGTGNNSIILVIELPFIPLIALYQCIKLHLIPFNSLRGMLRTDKLIIAKVKMGNNSVITCNRVTVLTLCIISEGRL